MGERSRRAPPALYICAKLLKVFLCAFFFANVDQCHVLENPIVPKKRLAFKYARGHCRQNYDHNLHMHSFVREIVISTRYIEKFEQNLFVFSTLIHTYLQKKLRSTLLRL